VSYFLTFQAVRAAELTPERVHRLLAPPTNQRYFNEVDKLHPLAVAALHFKQLLRCCRVPFKTMCKQALMTPDGPERHRRFYLAVLIGRQIGNSAISSRRPRVALRQMRSNKSRAKRHESKLRLSGLLPTSMIFVPARQLC
jgi:hypothetical protein